MMKTPTVVEHENEVLANTLSELMQRLEQLQVTDSHSDYYVLIADK